MKLGERLVHRLKRRIENIGVKITKQEGPVSEVISGKGKILPRPGREETLRVFGSGARRAVMRFALNDPDCVVSALNPKGLQALTDPLAAETAFHQQWAQPCKPDDYQDSFVPKAERDLGVIEFQPDDRRIKLVEKTYGFQPGSIGAKNLTDEEKNPVMVWDLVRPAGKIVGAPSFPAQEGWRPVRVPDIAGALGVKNAESVIGILGLVDTTQPEIVSGRQATLRTALVRHAGVNEVGLSPEFVEFIAEAFLTLAERQELPVREVIPTLLKQKK